MRSLKTTLKQLAFTTGMMVFAALLSPRANAESVQWISSTGDKPWQSMPAPEFTPADPESPPHVCVISDRTFQTIDGFGGCFNEISWTALSTLPEADRQKALTALFGQDGCAFNMGRVPIGASDFAEDAYSLDDTADDLKLTHFSIERDRKELIPYIKAAMHVQPELKCWASPWSPPAWMKTNNNYSKGSIRFEPPILSCYANYLAKWVQAYRAEGIDVVALAPQNESNILSAYPSCLWTGVQLRDFIADYLGPTFRDQHVDAKLWLGTMNGDPSNNGDNVNYRVATVMNAPKAAAFISAITFQYDSHNLIEGAHALYPEMKLVESETECNNGKNSWGDAQRLFGLMKHYIDNGASSYFAWNMILDESGLSTWKWKQNALITVNRPEKKLVFNGEYYVMRHFSQFVKPGAKRVLTTGPWGDKIAFANLDGSIVVVMGNSLKTPVTAVLHVTARADQQVSVTLPPASINTFVLPATKTASEHR